VRRQVCKRRIDRCRAELQLASVDAYRAYLAADPSEWAGLDAVHPILISRFFRDRAVFERLGRDVRPKSSEGDTRRRVRWTQCGRGFDSRRLHHFINKNSYLGGCFFA